MERFLFVTVVFFILLSPVWSQPVLTSLNFAQDGDQYSGFRLTGPIVSEGIAGANVTWDFSGLPAPADSLPYQFGQPSQVPAGTNFPGSNLFRDMESIDYDFLNAGDSSVVRMGEYNAISGMTVPFQKSFREFGWPATYQDMHTDSVTALYSFASMIFRRKGTYDVTWDAYGTLVTAFGINANVLRQRSDYLWTDSSGGTGIPGFIRSFKWYSPALRTPLMEYRYTQRDTGTGPFLEKMILIFSPLPVGRSHEISFHFQIFPNPATSEISLIRDRESLNSRWELISLTGEILFRGAWPAGFSSLRIMNLECLSGIYLIRIEEGGMQKSVKVIFE